MNDPRRAPEQSSKVIASTILGDTPPEHASSQPAVPTTISSDHPTGPSSIGLEQSAGRSAPLGPFGGYELLEVIARGGMGIVYKARQLKANRTVALKMILAERFASPEDVQRFETEASAAATLDHPNIVPVFEVGEHAGQHFYSMGFVDGPSLSEMLRNGPLTPKEAARVMRLVAQAVAYAHAKGVIHRDLKPQNILLSRDGSPRVADFGLAKQLSGSGELTATGQVLGTPNFMSPEQARGAHDEIGPLSDVYSLGAVLYCLLTGRSPFQAANVIETLRQVATQEPVSPRLLNAAVDLDLETITLKCLQKEPAKRYTTATQLADDLDNFLARRPIHARPVGATERVWRWSRRNPLAASLCAAIAMLLIVGGVGGTTLAVVASRNAVRADENALRADRNARQSDESARRADQKTEDALAREAETKAVLGFVENRIIAAARPERESEGLGRKVTLRKAIESALPYVAQSFPNQPLIEARLRLTMAGSFHDLGDEQTAAKQAEAARALYTRHRGPDHPDTLESMSDLAVIYEALGRYADALKLNEETLALKKAKLGPDHPETLISMNNLAASYQALGRYADALKLKQETLALRKAKLGPDHPATLMSMNNLANSYRALGRYADALKLKQEALALMKAKLGPDQPYTLLCMNSLASTYADLGRSADALKLWEETLPLGKAKLGADHLITLSTMNNLAEIYRELGRYGESVKLNQEALGRMEAKLPDHPFTFESMSNLAKTYAALGRHAEALRLNEKTLALRKAKLGTDDPDTLDSMCHLATSLVAVHRSAEAVPVIREAAAKLEKLKRTDPDSLYEAACFRAVTAAALCAADKSTSATHNVDAEADRAMGWLQQAVAAGYRNTSKMKTDMDLDSLRGREDFKKLLAGLEGTKESEKAKP
jgi:eukaryotic-like serine/threonine-protein kinase